MIKLEPEPDSIIDPMDELTERMKLEGSSNDTDHNQFTSADETNALGDGVPGYETTGQEGTDDQLSQQIEAQSLNTPKMKPF